MRGFAVALTMAMAAGLAASPAAAGVVMTFDNLVGNNGDRFSSHTENGFTLTKTAGFVTISYALGDSDYPGDPRQGLPSLVNNSFGVRYSLTAGGAAFTFDSIGLFVAFNNGAQYTFTGLRAGQTVYTISGFQGVTSNRFLQIAGNPAQVDQVDLAFDSSFYGGNIFGGSSNIDRLGTTLADANGPGGPGSGGPGGGGAVPEPATWAMLILGFGVSGATMRRRSAARRSTVAYAY